MARSKKTKPGSRMEALAEALNALNPPTLEVVIRFPGPVPEGARLERRLISTVVAKDKATVINVYQEEPVRDVVPPAHARGAREADAEAP